MARETEGERKSLVLRYCAHFSYYASAFSFKASSYFNIHEDASQKTTTYFGSRNYYIRNYVSEHTFTLRNHQKVMWLIPGALSLPCAKLLSLLIYTCSHFVPGHNEFSSNCSTKLSRNICSIYFFVILEVLNPR